MTRVTGSEGHFLFDGLRPGEYSVEEIVPEGYYPTSPEEAEVVLEAGETERVDFLNAPHGSVHGYKYLDPDGDGEHDEGEPGLAGVTIRLLDAEGRVLDTRVTGSEGHFLFDGLRPGEYSVEEIVPEGYKATSQVKESFSLEPGEEKRVDFLNAVLVAGEVVTPPVTPPMVPIVGGETGTLPATGFAVTLLLIAVGILLAAGALALSLGMFRMRRPA